MLAAQNSDYIKKEKGPELFGRYFDHVDLRWIPDAGHWLHADQPHLVIDQLADFHNKREVNKA